MLTLHVPSRVPSHTHKSVTRTSRRCYASIKLPTWYMRGLADEYAIEHRRKKLMQKNFGKKRPAVVIMIMMIKLKIKIMLEVT